MTEGLISQPTGIKDYHLLLVLVVEAFQSEAEEYELDACSLVSYSRSHHLRMAREQLTEF